jgi:vacuolar protein sorting-associated protein VTA1
MKKEIGENDAVDMQAASIAYVENFALKVFSSADEEDRKGQGSRSTAKKFLAAANFLEVLKIFPKEDIPESVGL